MKQNFLVLKKKSQSFAEDCKKIASSRFDVLVVDCENLELTAAEIKNISGAVALYDDKVIPIVVVDSNLKPELKAEFPKNTVFCRKTRLAKSAEEIGFSDRIASVDAVEYLELDFNGSEPTNAEVNAICNILKNKQIAYMQLMNHRFSKVQLNQILEAKQGVVCDFDSARNAKVCASDSEPKYLLVSGNNAIISTKVRKDCTAINLTNPREDIPVEMYDQLLIDLRNYKLTVLEFDSLMMVLRQSQVKYSKFCQHEFSQDQVESIIMQPGNNSDSSTIERYVAVWMLNHKFEKWDQVDFESFPVEEFKVKYETLSKQSGTSIAADIRKLKSSEGELHLTIQLGDDFLYLDERAAIEELLKQKKGYVLIKSNQEKMIEWYPRFNNGSDYDIVYNRKVAIADFNGKWLIDNRNICYGITFDMQDAEVSADAFQCLRDFLATGKNLEQVKFTNHRFSKDESDKINQVIRGRLDHFKKISDVRYTASKNLVEEQSAFNRGRLAATSLCAVVLGCTVGGIAYAVSGSAIALFVATPVTIVLVIGCAFLFQLLKGNAAAPASSIQPN